jgi:hypothetical protein
MTEYTTETGLYVLCDPEGRVISKADVPPGTHQVGSLVDSDETYDVEDRTLLHNVEIDSHYQDS